MVWRLTDKAASLQERRELFVGAASTQYVSGALYKMVNGVPVVLAGQTDTPFLLVETMDCQPYNGELNNVNGANASPMRPATELLTTTKGERVGGVPINGMTELDCDVAPLCDRQAANANSTANLVLVTIASTDNDYDGGMLFCPELGWLANITDSQETTGVTTFTVNPPPPRAITTGDTVSAIPFGPGAQPKFDGTAYSTTLSNVAADKTGGNVSVKKVKPKTQAGAFFVVTCQMKSPI